MFLQTLRSHFGRICLITSMVLLLPVENLAQPSRNAKPQAANAPSTSSPEDIMDLGLYYYNNDDVSDRAAQSFKQLLSRKCSVPHCDDRHHIKNKSQGKETTMHDAHRQIKM